MSRESLRHTVEISCQLAQLILADLLRPVSIIARRHSFGRLRQQPYRFCQQRRDQLHDQDAGEQHDERHFAV